MDATPRFVRVFCFSALPLGLLPLAAPSSLGAEPSPPPPPGVPVYLGAVVRNCESYDEGLRSIANRLRQMGEDVRAPSTGSATCVDPSCAQKLAGTPGYLLGAQVVPGPAGEMQTQFWAVDLANARVAMQRHQCLGCDQPENLARQAAALTGKLTSAFLRWTPLREFAVCATSGGAPEPDAVPRAPKDPRIALAVYSPAARSSTAPIQRSMHRMLEEMGLKVREVRGIAAPANPRNALPAGLKELRLLDVQLLWDSQAEAVDGAVVRLSDGRGGLQANIECPAAECQPDQLARLVRRNASALLDQSDSTKWEGAPQSPPQCWPTYKCVVASPPAKLGNRPTPSAPAPVYGGPSVPFKNAR